ncbi:zf-TFIIB domain-containing protein [Falsihalocynthiibacter sp. S25ZX9]|uniref:zf-TFIIB domain-containing protein n=1 Tax=Falsihalocynthiibacter sp. S25ZX9 TaxID=3240870 RepID=UPI00350FF9D6
MKCPVDGETLVMTDRCGVEIDYCPTSRGTSTTGAEDRDWDDDDRRSERDKPRNKRRGSLLGELFDF